MNIIHISFIGKGKQKTIKSTIHKYVVNVAPVTNPAPMSKSDKQTIKTIKLRFSPKSALIRFRESWIILPCLFCLFSMLLIDLSLVNSLDHKPWCALRSSLVYLRFHTIFQIYTPIHTKGPIDRPIGNSQ